MFNINNSDIKRLFDHYQRLDKAISWLQQDPHSYQKFDLLVSYFIASDDLRRMIEHTKKGYHSYDSEIYFMKFYAQFNRVVDGLKRIAAGHYRPYQIKTQRKIATRLSPQET